MDFPNLMHRLRVLIAPSHNVSRRALYTAALLLPGSVITLPLLWWLDRRGATTPGRANPPLNPLVEGSIPSRPTSPSAAVRDSDC